MITGFILGVGITLVMWNFYEHKRKDIGNEFLHQSERLGSPVHS